MIWDTAIQCELLVFQCVHWHYRLDFCSSLLCIHRTFSGVPSIFSAFLPPVSVHSSVFAADRGSLTRCSRWLSLCPASHQSIVLVRMGQSRLSTVFRPGNRCARMESSMTSRDHFSSLGIFADELWRIWPRLPAPHALQNPLLHPVSRSVRCRLRRRSGWSCDDGWSSMDDEVFPRCVPQEAADALELPIIQSRLMTSMSQRKSWASLSPSLQTLACPWLRVMFVSLLGAVASPQPHQYGPLVYPDLDIHER